MNVPVRASCNGPSRAACLARRLAKLSVALALPVWVGCAVPQPRGAGKLEHLNEPSTGRGYYLYLPQAYEQASEAQRKARRWPLVLTFHGMKPFDIAFYQACEWQQEADRFGFIVIAPELVAPDLFQQFPLHDITPALKEDEHATLAIIRYVLAHTQADPGNVLATSWSSGGYMAHYMLNRHPDVFTCLGVRQSDFSASILESNLVSRSLYHPVLIVNTQNDFEVCRKESQEAVKWYESHGYKYVAWVKIKDLGHERTPDTAADFFGRVAAVEPMRPQEVLVNRQAIEGNPTGLALLSGKMGQVERPTLVNMPRPSDGSARPLTQPRPTLVAAKSPPAGDGVSVRRSPIPIDDANGVSGPATPPRGAATPPRSLKEVYPLSIDVNFAIGFEPFLLSAKAACPKEWLRTADFLWMLDGQTIGHGEELLKTISDPGEYTLGLLAVTEDGKEFRASKLIRVLGRRGASAAK